MRTISQTTGTAAGLKMKKPRERVMLLTASMSDNSSLAPGNSLAFLLGGMPGLKQCMGHSLSEKIRSFSEF